MATAAEFMVLSGVAEMLLLSICCSSNCVVDGVLGCLRPTLTTLGLATPKLPLFSFPAPSAKLSYAGFDEVFSLWCLSTVDNGGLDWSTVQIGQVRSTHFPASFIVLMWCRTPRGLSSPYRTHQHPLPRGKSAFHLSPLTEIWQVTSREWGSTAALFKS